MKKIISVVVLSAVCSFSMIANDSKANISRAMGNILDEMGTILPENSSLLAAQPDAYIGKLFPSIPIHMTAGFSVDATILKTAVITDSIDVFADSIEQTLKEGSFIDSFDINIDLPSKVPLPSAAFSARVGGVFLPFDLGFFGMTTGNAVSNIKMDDFESSLNYSTFGIDLRYCISEGTGPFPKLSLGAGYIYSSMDFDMDMKKDITIQNSTSGTSGDGYVSGNIDMAVKNHTMFASLQASKKLLVFTPYIGIKGMLTKVEKDFKWDYKTVAYDEALNEIVKESNLSDADSEKDDGKFDLADLSTQVFGGLGIEFGFFQMAFNIAYNFKNEYFSGGLGLNFKM